MDPHAPQDLLAAGRDADLPRTDQLGELGRRRPGGTLAPEPALGDRVDGVDEIAEIFPARQVNRPEPTQSWLSRAPGGTKK
jgi:hypothetical protein